MSKTVLIVDDDHHTHHILIAFLTKRGYQVEGAYDGREGLEKIRATPPDLVLLDINMPKIDGLNLLDLLKQSDVTKEIPVLMLTANAKRITVLRTAKMGVEDYICKPFDFDLLSQRIGEQLLELEAETVREILPDMERGDHDIYASPDIKDFIQMGWDAYVRVYQQVNLCILIPKETKPAEAVNFTPEQLKRNVIVFARLTHEWKTLWPKGQVQAPVLRVKSTG